MFLILPYLQNLGIYPGIAGGPWSAGQHFLFELFLTEGGKFRKQMAVTELGSK